MNTTDKLLDTYGIIPLADWARLTDQIIILYCHRKGLPIPAYYYTHPSEVLEEEYMDIMHSRDVGEDVDHPTQPDPMENPEFVMKVKEKLAYSTDDPILRELLPYSSYDSHEYLMYEDLCCALANCNNDCFEMDYAGLLIASIQSSAGFQIEPQYTFRTASAISVLLGQLHPDSVEEYEVDSCFLAAMLPAGLKFQPFSADNKYYRFLPVLRDAFGFHVECQTDETDLLEITERAVVCSSPSTRLIERCEDSGDVRWIIVPDFDACDNESELVSGAIWCGYLSEIIDSCSINISTGRQERILVLDLFNPTNTIRFEDFDGQHIRCSSIAKEPVPYEDIVNSEYHLIPSFYSQPVIQDGEELRLIGDLCEIDQPSSALESHPAIPFFEFSSDFRRIRISSDHPKIEPYKNSFTSLTYEGPHVHLSRSHGFGLYSEVFVSNTPGRYHCANKSNYALRIKDNSVNPFYLAYVLSHDEDFCLTFMTANPTEKVLLNKKISVLKDRKAQDAFVAEMDFALAEVVCSDARYRVVYVEDSSAPILTEETASQFEEWQIENAAVVESVAQLKSFLSEDKNAVDAVVMDASVDSSGIFFKGLRNAISICHQYDIPLYSYTRTSKGMIAEALFDDEYNYLSHHRLYEIGDVMMLKHLVMAMRDELDGKGIPSALILLQYKKEFEAARWIDSISHDFHIASDMRYVLSQPSKALNSLRGVFRNLLRLVVREICLGSGLENVDLGAIPGLLYRGYYQDSKNTGRQYTIVGQVMPEALSNSLVFANSLLNAASHSEQSDGNENRIDFIGYLDQTGSDHLPTAVINIVMDFILWIRKSECKFDGYCKSAGMNERKKVDLSGSVVKVKSDEYYCDTEIGRIHIYVSKNFKYKDGMKAHIFEISDEQSKNMREKYEFFSKDGWELI